MRANDEVIRTKTSREDNPPEEVTQVTLRRVRREFAGLSPCDGKGQVEGGGGEGIKEGEEWR